jgi:glycosyltransferase involved in cell wall biosynthesis
MPKRGSAISLSSIQSTYWYAPFNNAFEEDLGIRVADILQREVVIQTCSHRFGLRLPDVSTTFARFARDLPPPAGELGENRSLIRRANVVRDRSSRRYALVCSNNFSLAHLHTFNIFSDWAAIRRLRTKVPVIIQSVHDVRPHIQHLPKRIETSLLGRGYRSFDALIVAHSHLAELLINDFGIDPERISVVPLPVRDFPEVVPLGPRFPGQKLSVLFFGTFRENKGIRVLIEAIDRLRDEENLRFTFAGRGETSLERAVSDLTSRDDRVSCEIGYIPDLRLSHFFNAADIIVLPYTRFESQSGVLTQDAYGAGRPVIASDIGALGQAISTDRTGWLVPPASASDLADMILRVTKHTEEFNNCVSNVRQVAQTRSLDQIALSIVDVYRKVCY